MRFLSSILLLCCLFAASQASGWSYSGDTGPANWGEDEPQCNGQRQSPIDIDPSATKMNDTLAKFDATELTAPTSMKLKNTGHSIKVNIAGGYKLPKDMGSLPGEFVVDQFHFHWGAEVGSEHTFEGKQAFGEMHIVHHNTKFHNLSVSLGQTGGVAVLGFFVDADGKEDHKDFQVIVDMLSQVPNTDDEVPFTEAMPISSFVPSNIDNYYRYSGSLTTPPCSEEVTWTIFENRVKISPAQAQALKNLKSIVGNFRPVQKINGRQVSANFDNGNGAGGIMGATLPLTVILLLATLANAMLL